MFCSLLLFLLSCFISSFSIFSGFNKISLLVINISLSFVNIRIIQIFTLIALSLFKTHESMITPCCKTERSIAQTRTMFFVHLQHKVIWESPDISFNCLFKHFCFYALQCCKISVNHYIFSSYHVNITHNSFIRKCH